MPVSSELRDLQEALDANKEHIPDGAYLELMAHVRNLYRAREAAARTFHQAGVVEVVPVSSRRVTSTVTTYILEEVERGAPPTQEGWLETLRTAQVTRETARHSSFPLVLRDGRGGLLIVVSCEEIEEDSASETEL